MSGNVDAQTLHTTVAHKDIAHIGHTDITARTVTNGNANMTRTTLWHTRGRKANISAVHNGDASRGVLQCGDEESRQRVIVQSRISGFESQIGGIGHGDIGGGCHIQGGF